MVARNEEKMKGKIEEIKTASPSVECQYIVCDLGKLTKMNEFREVLGQKIESLDIAVGIANAGYGYAGKFEDNDDEYLETCMNLNAIHVYYTMKILSEKMLKREKRSALIVTSSMAAFMPLPAAVVYSS